MNNLFFVLTFIFLSLSVKADAPEKIMEKYQKIRDDLNTSEENKRQVLSDLYSVHKNIRLIEFKRERLVSEKQFTEKQTRDIAKKIATLDEKLAEQKSLLKLRLKAIYKFSGQDILRLLFSNQSAVDLDRNFKIMKIISNRDYKLIKKYQSNVKNYQKLKVKLHASVRRLMGIEKDLLTQQRGLAEQQSQKNSILEQVEKLKLGHLKDIDRIRDETRYLASTHQLDSGQASSVLQTTFMESKGHLPTPVKGILKQAFQNIEETSDQDKVKFREKGHFYSASNGTKVFAVHPGQVVFADKVEGYHKVLILNHGEHYHSVYANVGKFLVNVGDMVKSEQPIAEASSFVSRLGQGVYFEIRHFSEPLDPSRWLK